MSRRAGAHQTAIRLESVGVYFEREADQPRSLKELVIRSVRGRGPRQFVRALEEASVEIRQGEVFGVIGRNGAGKTTLLRVISRIQRPSQGRVRVWGRVTPLLGVGAGFNEELNAQENVFLFSSHLGRTRRRTQELLPAILDFADLGRFVEAPIRTYSSGMVARLGFAAAMIDDPEILLVDEVLAVGDESFKAKCMARFEAIRKAGATVVLVSHSLDQVRRICRRACWLKGGRVMAVGPAEEIVAEYRTSILKARTKAKR